MSNFILKAEDISKQYRLGLVGTGTITHDLNRFWHRIRGKEDPYLKVGAVNDRAIRATEDYVWALRDINFEVEQGEVLGIIGKNGAGKSTLLKILSRVTSPTTGVIKTKGRIASLLEVGTGFHPELTGRENIYLNGAILGMTRSEIKAKEEEIVDFSGCELYIDTPVKRYSSGMRVRLGFAVAAHLEPDILVVDEVLAVGDAEFQKKAIGKMQDVSRTDGKTVLFVSHNMTSVTSLCSRAIVLENGNIDFTGPVDEAIKHYIRSNNESSTRNVYVPKNDKTIISEGVKLIGARIISSGKNNLDPIRMDEDIVMECEILSENKNVNLSCIFQFMDETGQILFVTSSYQAEQIDSKNQTEKDIILFRGIIPANFFNEGQFGINIMIVKDNSHAIIFEKDILSIYVNPKPKALGTRMAKSKGPLKPSFKWYKVIK